MLEILFLNTKYVCIRACVCVCVCVCVHHQNINSGDSSIFEEKELISKQTAPMNYYQDTS